MKGDKSFSKFQVFSTIFSLISGVLLHFAYEWSDNNTFVGLFSAVNESTWEHLKLVFFPSLIYFLFEYFSSRVLTPGTSITYICDSSIISAVTFGIGQIIDTK